MSEQRINHLLQKYLDGSINDVEKQELFGLYQKIGSQGAEYPDDKESTRKRILLRLNKEIEREQKPVRYFRSWRMAAAVAVVLLTAGIFIVRRPVSGQKQLAGNNTPKQLILPGTNVATLTLGNGKRILLNGANKGTLAMQGNTMITRNATGQVSYKVINNNGAADQQVVYNTISTPKGGQFEITLPDGSNVWLNAASSLTYPSVFKGTERHVELHGEAYFEIFKNKNMPFTVTAENTNIKVLGTHFNVMAYGDEPSVNTTLLEGSVALSSKFSQATIVPGQQAAVDRLANNIVLKQVNVEDAVAWKNGYFSFKKEHIQTVMNKIARWYDVDVEYKGDISTKILGGTVSRASDISELLNYLELTGIAKFRIEGRRIIVICK